MLLGLATGSHVNLGSDFFLQPVLVIRMDPQNELAQDFAWPPRLNPRKGKSFSDVSSMQQALLLELRGIETNPLLATFEAFSEVYTCDLASNSFHVFMHISEFRELT